MDDLKLIEHLGIDLSDRTAAVDAAAEAERRLDDERKLRYARAWEKMVQRAAKGIIPRPQRHKRMIRAVERMERQEAEQQRTAGEA